VSRWPRSRSNGLGGARQAARVAFVATEGGGQISTREPPTQREDDWFAEEDGLDWGFEPEHDDEVEPPRRERARTGLVQPGRVAPETPAETYQRRRRVLAFAAIAVAVVIVIIIAVVATGGGGGSPTAVPTTPTVTQPVTASPTPSNTPTTTATQTSTSLHVTVPAGGNLSAGDSGNQVLTLQKALKQLGLDVGTPDGKFGQKTQDAVKAFQTAHNLTPDGVVGNDTARAINDAVETASG
jgi:hypothetical protein